MIKRRQFLQSGLAAAAMVSSAPRLSFAAGGGDRRFVFVILRGGMDGLAAVPAWGDSSYRSLRGSLALGKPGAAAGVLDLDGHFGLHPQFAGLHRLYQEGQMLVVHAVASSYRERSHFDGQKQLENGTNSPLGAKDGWLNRALQHLPEKNNAAIALAQNVPLVLYGDSRINSWSPAVLPEADADTINRIARMYESDAFFNEQFESAMQTRAMAEDLQGGAMSRRRGRRMQDMDVYVKAAGRFLRDEAGPRIAVLESGGWDTHANQGAEQGQLANRFGQLDKGLALLKKELGSVWNDTVVLVASEFGRTVAVNGSAGTDHGTAGAVFLLGGAVAGGRVVGDWPGLKKSRLYEGRDLQATTDIRSLFKTVLHEHMRIPARALDQSIFPGSNKARRMTNLLIT